MSMSSNKSILFVSIPLLVLLVAVSLFILRYDEKNEAELANNIIPNNLYVVSDNITLRLMQDYYPPDVDGITMILENNSDSVLKYGYGHYFEKYEDGSWITMEQGDVSFPAIEIILGEHETQTLYIPVVNLGEPFSEGLYRVCGLNRLRYQLEFVISRTAPAEALPVAFVEMTITSRL